MSGRPTALPLQLVLRYICIGYYVYLLKSGCAPSFVTIHPFCISGS